METSTGRRPRMNPRIVGVALALGCAGVAGACNRTSTEADAVSTTIAALAPAATSGVDRAPGDEARSVSVSTPTATDEPVDIEPTVLPATTAGSNQASQLDCVASLPVDLKVRQTLMPALYGDQLDAGERLVRDHGVGGLILMTWPAGSDPAGLARVKGSGSLPVLLSVDEEGGSVQRLRSLGAIPSQQTVAETMNLAEAEQLIADHAVAVRELGIDVVFSPVADVGVAVPIGDRSFGSDPATVSAFVDAYVRGWNAASVLPVVKHFPGHGHATADTHLAEASTPPLAELWESDLVPYRDSAIAGTAGVMVGHLLVPGLTDVEGLPASLSPSAIAMLRNELGFGEALVFTDSLNMSAISDRFSLGDAGVQALGAGVDVLVYTNSDQTATAAERIEAAVTSGELDELRLDDAVGRILSMKGVDPCSVVVDR